VTIPTQPRGAGAGGGEPSLRPTHWRTVLGVHLVLPGPRAGPTVGVLRHLHVRVTAFSFFLRAPLVTGSGPSPPLVPGPLRIPARFQGSGVARRFSFPKEDLPGAYPWRTCSGPSRLLVLLAGSSRSGPPGAAPLWVASRPVPAAASPPPLPRVRARHSPLSVAPRVRGLVPRPGRGRRFAAVAHAGPSSALSSERRSSRTGPRAPSWPPLRRRRLRGSELAGGALRLL